MSRKKYQRKYWLSGKEVDKETFMKALRQHTVDFHSVSGGWLAIENFNQKKFDKAIRQLEKGVGIIYVGGSSFRIIKKEVK